MTWPAFTSIRRSGRVRCESASTCVTVAGRCDEHRRVRTEEQQRGEVDDEGRAASCRSPPRSTAARREPSQNRGQDQAGEFKGPVRLRPAAESQQHDSAGRDRREDEQAGVPRERSHLARTYRYGSRRGTQSQDHSAYGCKLLVFIDLDGWANRLCRVAVCRVGTCVTRTKAGQSSSAWLTAQCSAQSPGQSRPSCMSSRQPSIE